MAGSRQMTVIWIVAGVVLALLAGAGAGWLARGSAVRALEERVADLEAKAEAEESEAASETVEATWTVPSSASEPEEPPVTETPREESTGVSEIQPGLVKTVVNDAGTWKLTIDYIQFLTGAEAADAAAARGDESPPPNDYYVINDNPKIREFPIQAGIGVGVVTNDDGTSDASGHTMSLSQWAAAMTGPHAVSFSNQIYWVTVTDGTITAIQAQYVP